MCIRDSPKGGSGHVLSLVNRDTGEVRSTVLPYAGSAPIEKHMTENVDLPNTHLETDSAKVYKQLGKSAASHAAVDHYRGEYVVNGAGTNPAENYFSQLKRSLHGTHHQVSVKHLSRYLGEFDFRFSTRDMSDAQRMSNMIGSNGFQRPLSWDRLTAE